MRLELKTPGVARFQDFTLDGCRLTTRSGRLGTAGEVKVEELATPTAARAAYETRMSALLTKGYQLAPGQLPIIPRGNVDPHLEELVEQNPDDPAPYLVLADALNENGDPRGELITVQHAQAEHPADAKLRARERKLLLAFNLPDLAHVKLRWRWGFIQQASFRHENPVDLHFDPTGLARDVFQMPMAAVIEKVSVGMMRWDNLAFDLPSMLREAAKHGWAKRLRALQLGHFNGAEMLPHPIGDVSMIARAFPALQALGLRSGEFTVGPLDLPALKDLQIETCCLSKERLRAVTHAQLPSLERLELWFGSSSAGCDVGVEHLARILDGGSFRSVKHLGLRNAELTDALCEAMPDAGILPQLEVLDLSMGMMTDRGARALTKRAGAFAHLASLNVDDNCLTEAGKAMLLTLGCPIEWGRQKDPKAGYPAVTAAD